ncbi:hypothetical protein [Streptomyces sp. cg2]|uniref:hypothetical protein n=1 Tax=Streptomyces sp. cg2 TaxID=3238799 RepID=UPI0034E27B80
MTVRRTGEVGEAVVGGMAGRGVVRTGRAGRGSGGRRRQSARGSGEEQDECGQEG